MPDLRMSYPLRRNLLALVVVLAGIVAIAGALLGTYNSSKSDDPQSTSKNTSIEPVAPIESEDVPEIPETKPNTVDETGPFADSYGKSSRRKVEIQVTGNGAVNIAVTYRDGKKPDYRVVNGNYTVARTFKGKYPMAAVAAEIPKNAQNAASRATCSITIDGVEVTKQTTTRANTAAFCVS